MSKYRHPSLQVTQPELSTLAQVNLQLQKTRQKALKKQLPLHLLYLEYFNILEMLAKPLEARLIKTYQMQLAKDVVPYHEVLSYLVGSLTPADLQLILNPQKLGELNHQILSSSAVITMDKNEWLMDKGIDAKTLAIASSNLKYELGFNNQKASASLVLYLCVIRASCDPRIKRISSLAHSNRLLNLATEFLQNILEHLVHHEKSRYD